MKLTAELSLYPLQEDYIPVIDSFIVDCNKDPGLTVVTNAMSTQICGEHDQVFDIVSRALRQSFQRNGKQILVCKFIPAELDIAG